VLLEGCSKALDLTGHAVHGFEDFEPARKRVAPSAFAAELNPGSFGA
jgi:hypothetical protein